MSDRDRVQWEERYRGLPPVTAADIGLPATLRPFADAMPERGAALDLACGRGGASVWLAQRGMTVHGFDVSPTAVHAARELAELGGVAARCHFAVADLDDGVPPGDAVDLLLCSMFRLPAWYGAMMDRVVRGGLVAVSVLSEVGAAGPGRYRAPPGELTTAFGALTVIAAGEGDGRAWLVARR
ncbi:class I SAM-dependent methyltransferase [Mycolicibacterium sp. 018/SC-01/001]|uniref:class I SAM-dependent methyltransferase n=1 Tax=Mycolicibacterium sp. 018/SC-01/001 TaxID=2592069 RepID=UPI00117E2AF3|nr:class I SAM-dependent methyltransferase [Mycolicibacterium sp. 018/SC-01/001]TRW77023.1 class I SAM-dependent methyltransferase [Mycolicibacterium sp. 018/SC-01/001]